MAKSIFEILADLNTETSVPGFGDSIQHTIPRALFPGPEVFENEDKLLSWADANGYVHALLQMGLQKGLIDIRAKFKSCKKSDTWSSEYGQKNVNAHKWEITERPKAGGTAKIKAQAELEAGIKLAQAMKIAKVDNGVILASLTPVYGEAVAKEIIASLE